MTRTEEARAIVAQEEAAKRSRWAREIGFNSWQATIWHQEDASKYSATARRLMGLE